MRILHLIPHLSRGGAERQLSYLAPELARIGHDVHIAYFKAGPSKLGLSGVVLHQLRSWSNYDPYLFWQLAQLIRGVRPDIVQTWILQMDILGGMAARFSGIPWVFREASSALAYPPTWKYRWRVHAGSGANAVVSNSHGGDEYWKNRLPGSRRYVVLNGLPVEEIDRTVAAFPGGLADTETPIVLYVGRLSSDVTAHKNLRAFLETLAILRKKKEVLGVLCGEGPQRCELEELSRRLGLEGHVRFTGHLPAAGVWALMKKAAVFVSLSAYEGCPNAVMEAMACGCPLVLSDIPGHREILDEDCAFFVDPSDIQQIADAVAGVLSNEEATQARVLNARQKTLQWSIPEMARKYEQVYKICLDGKSRVKS